MAAVDPLYAQWLQGEVLYATRADAALAGRWGDAATVSERLTGIATRTDALAEADRALTFLSRGPFAIDVHQLVGADWHRQLGQVVNLTADRLGYDAGIDVFVLGAEPDRSTGLSQVTVLCPVSVS